jgi:sigma54-dependent transcription regulator
MTQSTDTIMQDAKVLLATAYRMALDHNDSGFDYVDLVLGKQASDLDLFDRHQLNFVLRTLAVSRSIADAGRKLYAVSMQQKKSHNSSDRLSKYLSKFCSMPPKRVHEIVRKVEV